MPSLCLEAYLSQYERWPRRGRHVLAQFDEQSVVVYQAYGRSIGNFAKENGHFFGGGFSFNRMSWIKPNFLWMMYRSGWASKPGQEVVLAVWIARTLFDTFLAEAVPSNWDRTRYSSRAEWKKATNTSNVLLQWDPDHDPAGGPIERRALQLGLRGDALESFARPIQVEDISDFVHSEHAKYRIAGVQALTTPREDVYPCRQMTASLLSIAP